MKQRFKIIRQHLKKLDFALIGSALFASAFGLVLVLTVTASANRPISRQFLVQLIAVCIGLVAMLVISVLDIDLLTDLWPLIYLLAAAAIVVTILFGHGPTGTSSNRNWLRLGPVDVQPAEFVKLAYILILAKGIDKVKERINRPLSLLYLGALSGGILLLMLLQKDMGTTLVFVFITVVMLFCGGLGWYFFAAGGAALLAVLPLLWGRLPDYMRNRILYGFRPELDPRDIGFQALQSKIAIGSGQLTGKGLFKGTQISLLPAKETDFIFASAGEEFGFLGCMLILALLITLLLRMLLQARRAVSDTGTLICIGVFALFAAQIFENVGMCLAMLPVVGITLPFFSYGGSSMISCWCAVGLVLTVAKQRYNTLSFLDPPD
ncbi:MAG: FtsW/RodA/SpoVE family cell cycle protein [Clostridiales bacterium]|nr:FtsW/RodA/SpoVE family cell cycle protein [Clostridiales bacterium]